LQLAQFVWVGVLTIACGQGLTAAEETERTPLQVLYMPLADHYTAILAVEWYGATMEHADVTLRRMRSWELLRAAFHEERADLACIICPDALDLFSKWPHFRWVGLLHRDGNTMILNRDLAQQVNLAQNMADRTADAQLAHSLRAQQQAHPEEAILCGVPHRRATHTVVVYKYLKDHGLHLSLQPSDTEGAVVAEVVSPPQTLSFIRRQNNRGNLACTQQSLPWGPMVEEIGDGQVAWFSRDVLQWPNGHVECILIATDAAIEEKKAAVREYMDSIEAAGARLEVLRKQGGTALKPVIEAIRKHLPEHTESGIREALDPGIGGIRFDHLRVDANAIGSLRAIMELGIEGGILEHPVDLKAFAKTPLWEDAPDGP
jgi:NitT/TauT family transport system substrate-binding protein